MKSQLLPIIAALAATAAADSTACAAEAILDACLDTTEGYLSLCGSQDYSCLCEKYTTIMTCFANCPNDDRQYAIDSERQLYCSNASAFSTKTTSRSSTATATTTTDSASATGSDDSDESEATTTYGDGGAENSSGSGSGNSPKSTAGAVPPPHAQGATSGGALAALAGLLAAALL
ncbi:hypothetical protein F4777DRAFT_185851 [Nemania sp. FL0916]|nr:hypothetical protein F4777DRAFT_185851 [Nemania sp. FL0916]